MKNLSNFKCYTFACCLVAAMAVSSIASVQAQKRKTTSIPRDSSFTLYQTFIKEQKRLPEIKMAQPELPANISVHESLVYSVIKNTAYGKRELHLNIYRPADQQIYPALLMIHGGGWHSGDLTLQIPLAQQIASRGYVTVTVEYRLSPEALYPAAVHDIKAAIRWLRANAVQYGVDVQHIALSGCSAGGQLANLVGMTGDVAQFEGENGNPQQSTAVQAVIDVDGSADFLVAPRIEKARAARAENKTLPSNALWLGGTFDEKPEIWKEASAVRWVTSKAPPICYINSYGRLHEGMDRQIEMLDSLKIYSEVHLMETTTHPFWLLHPWFGATVNYMTNFLDKTFKPTTTTIPEGKYHFVVAQDGSGDFTSVQAAIDAVPDFRQSETRIFIRNGVYREKIVLAGSKKFVTLTGENRERTIIMYDDYSLKKNVFGENKGTSGSAGFYVYGSDFTAVNITFENTAGPICQAVAMYVLGDRAAFYNCRFLGYQDTLYANGEGGRQYYWHCYIEGTTDFIFGNGTAWFEECTIYCKINSYITAASTLQNTKFGYIFNRCTITASPKVSEMYLGRPWRPFAMTVFMNTELPAVICPAAWHNWSNTANEQTARYMEYNNSGAGAKIDKRAAWAKILNADQASEYTLEKVMRDWSPKKGENL
ncbi:MAG: alpha/beta hydrolase fold domain-containing protein [Paludibacter sp.]|jgi:pectin methylesterase-like acyl-CoA thioesterase/acetyl esterase/lipase|nr:alpha/beta hydrolase fold domain-containing protein [Paludibacter sp.]